MQDSWPSAEPEPRRSSPLPRVEDMPVVERGYDPERVREAFDAFYRHLARLDATLRTIEAVEVFRDQAGELRKELRALRTAGWTQQPWLPTYSTRESARPGLPDTVVRWALEASFVIAAPVAASAADLSRLWILIAAAAAVAIVAAAEWLASRERPLVPTRSTAAADETPPEKPALPPEPAPADATAWTAAPSAAEEPADEELTAVAASAEPEAEPADEAQREDEPEEPVAEEPKQDRGRLWRWRRRRDGDKEEPESDEDRPRHVRVLPADGEGGVETHLDPWEEELEAEGDADPEPAPRGWGAT